MGGAGSDPARAGGPGDPVGRLAPPLKVRRRAIHDKYRALIDAMYAAPLRSDASPAA